MTRWDDIKEALRVRPRPWLVTGAAGFIGSHLVEDLLKLGQTVTAVDDFSTGSSSNLADVRGRVGEDGLMGDGEADLEGNEAK